MKKIFSIIVFIFIFSIPNFANANEWYIEQLLQLKVGPEAFTMNLSKIEDIYFVDSDNQEVFDSFKNTSEILRDEILRKYENDEFEYYTMQGIVSNYNSFVYYTNKLFYYLSIREQNSSLDAETENGVSKNYSKSRNYFKRLKYLIYKD
jgi:hypothetical protein